MLEHQHLTQHAALAEMRAAARVAGRDARERTGATTLTMQEAAVAALIATILLSGYMVAVG